MVDCGGTESERKEENLKNHKFIKSKERERERTTKTREVRTTIKRLERI